MTRATTVTSRPGPAACRVRQDSEINPSELTADDVIVGAGAVGMAMADTMVAETSARVIIVDRRANPGANWNDAYPFVRLHGPSATCGVNSMPMHDVDDDGWAITLVNGRRPQLVAGRRWVDATQADTQLPATHDPSFAVGDGVSCLTPTDLTHRQQPAGGHVIVGGGKTAMDTALWLLEQGVNPDTITWIRLREAWLPN